MIGRITVLAAVMLCVAYGDDLETRAKLIGSWQAPGDAAGAPSTVWSIQEAGDGIRITHSAGTQKIAEFECNTMGKECTTTSGGRKVKVSMYYNGPALVQIETRGSDVVKRRFQASADGDKMEIQQVSIAPAGKAETSHLTRAEIAADRR